MLSLIASVLGAAFAATAVAAGEELNETVPVESGGTLTIDLDRGRVDVESHDAAAVRVEARARGVLSFLGEFELETNGRDVTLSGWFQRLLFFIPWGLRVTVRAWVPRAYSIDVRTRGGGIAVEHINGRVAASTSGGTIDIASVTGGIDAETSGGAIHIARIAGNVVATTSGGAIDLERVDGNVEVVTSGGRIDADAVTGELNARTSGGRITASFAGAPGGTLETSGGGIEVEFAAAAGVDLDAETSGGRVDVEHRFTAREEVQASRVVGQINGGGPPLRLRTSGGSILVRAS